MIKPEDRKVFIRSCYGRITPDGNLHTWCGEPRIYFSKYDAESDLDEGERVIRLSIVSFVG